MTRRDSLLLLLSGAGPRPAAGSQPARLFEIYIYGRPVFAHPPQITYRVVAQDSHAYGDRALTKTIRIQFDTPPTSPTMEIALTLPISAKPVPVFLIAGNARLDPIPAIQRGYGIAAARIDQIQTDAPNGYAKSIRGYFAPSGQTEPGPEEWGAISAWAWALSRAMDFFATDPAIDAKRVCLSGAMRYGRVAFWAGAQDQRFAITFVQDAGFADTPVQLANGRFSYWLDRKLQGATSEPLAWTDLAALYAPRLLYIAAAQESGPDEERASLAVAKAAAKSGSIGYHTRPGDHVQSRSDWDHYLNFADQHLGER